MVTKSLAAALYNSDRSYRWKHCVAAALAAGGCHMKCKGTSQQSQIVSGAFTFLLLSS